MESPAERELRVLREYVRQFGSSDRKPHEIKNLVSRLMSRRGYGYVQQGAELRGVWAEVAGSRLAGRSQAGRRRGGVLDVYVADSALLQELNFQKRDLLKRLNAALGRMQTGARPLRDLRFQVGPVDQPGEESER